MLDQILYAIRNKVRFQLPQGDLNLEQVFDLRPYKSKTEKNEDGSLKEIDVLGDYEARLEDEVASYAKVSRRGSSTRTSLQKLTQLKLDIVSYALDIRDKEAQEAKDEVAIKKHNQEIHELLAEHDKKDKAGLSREQLKAMLR